MTGPPRTVLTGTETERGRTHGEAYADEIAHNAEFYLDHFADNGVDERTARRHAGAFVERLADYHEGYATEMRAVAEASGVSLEAVTLINVRHTILYSAYAAGDEAEDEKGVEGGEEAAGSPEPPAEGCTSFGIAPERSADSHTYVGQNWDWQEPVETFLMDVRRDDGPDYLTLTEAGNVGGKFGLNERGIGLVVNGLSTPADGRHPYRKPAHVRDREVFDATRLDRAVGAVVGEARPTSRNYLLGRAAGELIDLETSPDDVFYRYPEGGVVTHANHFETRGRVESILERRVPHSVTRGARVRRLFDRFEEVGESDMKRVLRDHVGEPKGLCRHLGGDESLSHTKASAILDLTDRRLLVTDGPPCEHEYREFRVGGS